MTEAMLLRIGLRFLRLGNVARMSEERIRKWLLDGKNFSVAREA